MSSGMYHGPTYSHFRAHANERVVEGWINANVSLRKGASADVH